MARKLSGGLVGEPSVGAINVAPTAVITAADNQDITLSPVGTGSVVATNNFVLNAQNDLRFGDADSSNYVGFQAPSTVSANVVWTLPATDGTSAQTLVTNGTGTLSWATSNVSLVDQTASSSTHFVTLTAATTDATITTLNRSSTKLTFQPSTGTLTATILSTPLLTATAANISGVLTATGGSTGIVGYTVQTTAANLADTDRLYIVANAAAITLTLPATSTNGRTIVLADGANFGTNNVTVARNGNTIGLLAENLVLNLQGSRVELVYYSGDWKLFII